MNSNAHEYKVNATKVALHLLREPDIFETNMKLFCAKDLEDAFIASAEWHKQKAIELHWKCCPNLSKDNDQMCKHLADCDRKCLYMNEFINQL